ncbi:XRE family transcriptional regulator [Dactylosporangium sp. CA-139114]|uniref:XRE family transcriptional regulator n=1 Tax=Dactylosporangium sp. CA-139114 TaxID=3239931 RepID=UPI003D97C28C
MLFEKVRKPNGERYTLREVADAVTSAGEPISYAYIGHLRSGEKDDPHLRHLRALAKFFGVPVEYFTSDRIALEVDRELAVAALVNEVRARTVALRQSVVPEAEQAIGAITRMLEAIRELEQRQPDTSVDDR